MAALSLKVKSYQNSKGLYQVAISLCHKSKTCYIPTQVSVTDPAHLKGLSIVKEKDFVEKTRVLNELLDKYYQKLNRLDWIDDYSCVELKNIIISDYDNKPISLKDVADEKLQILRINGGERSADMMNSCIKRFNGFIGHLMLAHITPKHINDFSLYLQNKNYSLSTIAMTLRSVRTVINYAIKHRYVRYDVHPFTDTVIPRAQVRELPLTLENFRKIYFFKPTYNNDTISRDLFLLSFFTGGANLCDMSKFAYHKGDDVIRYVRTKTNGTTRNENIVTIPVIDEARIILDKYVQPKGGLDFGYKYTDKNFTSFMSKCMKCLCKRLQIEDRVIMYSARKGFAQYALDLGTPDSTVDYCLGHSNSSRGIISYYSKVRVEQARVCLEAVAAHAIGRTHE